MKREGRSGREEVARVAVIMALLAMTFLAAVILLAFCSAALGQTPAGQPKTEVEWSRFFAAKYQAKAEAPLWDKTRVDLLSDREAIEVEWADKQYQAPGQATWYSIVSGRAPAVLLLVRDPVAEAKHVYRCTAICERLGIRLYVEVLP